EVVPSVFYHRPWLKKIPLVRGVIALFEMLALGLRTLERSGNLQAAPLTAVLPVLALPSEEGESRSAGALATGAVAGAMAIGFLIGVALFVFLPNALAALIGRWLGRSDDRLFLNLVEGVVRLLVFVGYIVVIGFLGGIRRVFMYHGAEHKVVNAFEAGRRLEVDDVLDMSVIHPRCGTNFAFIVVVMSLVVFCFLPWTQSIFPRIGMRLACLPLVAGLSYELIRLVGKYSQVACLRALIWPGLAMQRLTTREPTPDMLEVALASFNAVRRAEETGELTCERQGGVVADG
ncbi:MAG: DUF1385 domain-containing protein, partial [Armatimonadetes bacterium]|nr:DUF1385 domain-containing protein [Armatimonadota bacterium]